MENRQSKKKLKREDVNLNYLSDKDFETAKKSFEETPKEPGNKMSKVKKHTIISILLLIPGAMRLSYTNPPTENQFIIFVSLNIVLLFFFAFILTWIFTSIFSSSKRKLSFDRTLYKCCYLLAFLYLIDITHLDFLQLIGSIIRGF
jgi:cation transport ATPase